MNSPYTTKIRGSIRKQSGAIYRFCLFESKPSGLTIPMWQFLSMV
jgi:hypothetical protein